MQRVMVARITPAPDVGLEDAMRRLVPTILRGLVFDLDPRAIEVFTAQLSLWFAAVFALSPTTTKPQPVWLWVLWCVAAGGLKIGGVLPTLRVPDGRAWARNARIAGCFLGVGFWATLATFLLLISRFRGITWGGYALIALAQAWCLFRLFRGPVR